MNCLISFPVLIFIICIQSVSAQSHKFLDNDKIKIEIENGTGVTKEELCSEIWVVNTSIMQFVYDNPDDNSILDMEYNGVKYTFNLDGTFEVDAKWDSNGIWELRENGKVLYLYNNLRDDEELHSVLIDGTTMKWYYFVEDSLFYQYLSKK